MVKRLREDGLVEFGEKRVRVLDPAGLARLGEFNPDYLYLNDDFHTP
jgi:hypothetical protein